MIFLAEAFTRRAMMRALAKLGFSQSYTYFTWKNSRWELSEYVTELAYAGEQEYFRPNFFANTPDILHAYLQHGGPPAFEARLVLAATLCPATGSTRGSSPSRTCRCARAARSTWTPRSTRPASATSTARCFRSCAALNLARRENPALQHLSNITFLETENDALIAYVKRHRRRRGGHGRVPRSPPRAGGGGRSSRASWACRRSSPSTTCSTDERYDWRIGRNYVRLEPGPPGPPAAGRALVSRAIAVPHDRARILPQRPSRPRPSAGRSGRATGSSPTRCGSRRAVFYEIHIRGFFDGNDDGMGDFRGLTEKLDYLQWLGIDCIWLLPMYASPLRDGGYDIADFNAIHPDYGTVEDFRDFVEAAHQRGMRVIADLVMNHTSADHPWFQAPRSAPAGSPERDWYVWSDTDAALRGRADHLHRHRVLELDLGRGGRRLLLAPLLLPPARPQLRQPRRPGRDARGPALLARPRPRRLPPRRRPLPLRARGDELREPRPRPTPTSSACAREIDAKYPDRVLLAEANQWPEDVVRLLRRAATSATWPSTSRSCRGMFMALRREEADADRRDPRAHPARSPRTAQWGLFLRNHDELTLEMVTDEERDYMYTEYAKDPRMKLNLGIRRRLAPLHGQRARRGGAHARDPLLAARLARSSTTATRSGWATTSTWATATACGRRCSGPATATAASRARTSPSSTRRRSWIPVYGYQAVNVEAQLRTPTSFLRWLRRFVALRKEHPVFGHGSYEPLETTNHRIFAHIRRYEEDVVLCVHNLARSAQAVELDLGEYAGRFPEEMFGRTRFPRIGELPYLLTLAPRGFFWFQLREEQDDER